MTLNLELRRLLCGAAFATSLKGGASLAVTEDDAVLLASGRLHCTATRLDEQPECQYRHSMRFGSEWLAVVATAHKREAEEGGAGRVDITVLWWGRQERRFLRASKHVGFRNGPEVPIWFYPGV